MARNQRTYDNEYKAQAEPKQLKNWAYQMARFTAG